MHVLIETPRLILKPPTLDALGDVARLFSDPLVMRYIVDGKTRTKEEARKAIENNIKHWEVFGHGFGCIFEKETQKFIGRGGLIHVAFNYDNPEVELGYMLSPENWGKGYATEVAHHVLQWGFSELSVPYFVAMAYKENLASQKVLKKVGFVFDREDIYPHTNFKSLFFKIHRNNL